MATNVASFKQTSGERFDFENKVAAFFLLHMLSGINPFPKISGTISNVAVQKRVDGWLLDDIILTVANDSTSHFVAFSVKSNNQLAGCAFPPEFCLTAWKQLLSSRTQAFTYGKDWLGLITYSASLPKKVCCVACATRSLLSAYAHFSLALSASRMFGTRRKAPTMPCSLNR